MNSPHCDCLDEDGRRPWSEKQNLEWFDTYTSHRLHRYPYEITRCQRLRSSSVSTRALYENFKTRLPFPHLQPSRASTTRLELDDLATGMWGADSSEHVASAGVRYGFRACIKSGFPLRSGPMFCLFS